MTGARLAGLVLDRWRHLPELQHRPLMRMALRSLDQPDGDTPAATFWGSDRSLAETYRAWPADDSPHSPDERARRRRDQVYEVRRQIRSGLIPEGAIKLVDPRDVTWVETDHAVYRLTLERCA